MLNSNLKENTPKEKTYPYLADRNLNKNLPEYEYIVLFTSPNTGMVVHIKKDASFSEWLELGHFSTNWCENVYFTPLPPTTVIKLSN